MGGVVMSQSFHCSQDMVVNEMKARNVDVEGTIKQWLHSTCLDYRLLSFHHHDEMMPLLMGLTYPSQTNQI